MHKLTNSRAGMNRYSMTILSLLLGAILSLPLLSSGQDKSRKEFSLRTVQDFAIRNSFESKKSQLDILIAKKKLWETVAIGLPQVNSTVGYINNLELTTILIPNFFEGKFDEKIPIQFGTQHNANVNFTLSQLIFNGSYFVGLQTSKIYRQLADQNHERTQLNILARSAGVGVSPVTPTPHRAEAALCSIICQVRPRGTYQQT